LEIHEVLFGDDEDSVAVTDQALCVGDIGDDAHCVDYSVVKREFWLVSLIE
jgi:hypothetical protein